MRSHLFSLFLVMVIYPAFAQTTYYVSVNGSDGNSGLTESNAWRTITYAASASSPVSPGDIVHIKAGDYGNENIVFETNGTEGSPIKFIGYQNIPGDNPSLNYRYGDTLDVNIMPLIDGNDRTSGTGIVLHNREYIELSNVQIRNYQVGLFAYAGKHLFVKNIIAMTLGDPSMSYSGRGIVFGSLAKDNTIENCAVLNSCAEGMSIIGDDNIVKNCRIYADDNSTGHKSAMDYYIHVNGNNNLVENCYVERIGNLDHGGHGIDLKGSCENNIIRNCISKGMSYSGYELRHRAVKNNLIENSYAINCGFSVRDGASNNIIRNCKTVSAKSAVLLFDTTEDDGAQYAGRNNRFENCIFQNTVNSQIDFFHYGSAAVSNVDSNHFVNCVFDGGQYLFNSDRVNFDNSMSNSIVINVQNYVGSSFYSNPFPISFSFSDSYFYNNGFPKPSGDNVHDENPLLRDTTNHNYSLVEYSPCIDNGSNTGAPSVDYNGNPRPINGIVDIGAFEKGSNSTMCNTHWSENGMDIYYSLGNVGIGTNNPAHKLHVAGDVAVAGAIISPSDLRLKKDVHDISNGLSILSSLSPKSYFYKEEHVEHGFPGNMQFGFIAQDVEKVLPWIVNKRVAQDDEGSYYKGIDYRQLIPFLTQAINELRKENENLIIENKESQKAISNLMERLEALEARK